MGPLELFIIVIISLVWLVPCALKGKWWFFWLGLLVGALLAPIGCVGAIRLARPDSWWSKKFYGHAKLKKSWERYNTTPYVVGASIALRPEDPSMSAGERC